MANKTDINSEQDQVHNHETFLTAADNDPFLAALTVVPRKALYELMHDFIRTINQMLTQTDKDEIMATVDSTVKSDCEKVTSEYIKSMAGSPLRGENHPRRVINQALNFWYAYLDEVRKRNLLPSPV